MKDWAGQVSGYLAENTLYLRRMKNMSQAQLSHIAEIPRSTLTHIESGLSNPSLSNLIKLSQALGVSLEELLSKPRAQNLLIPAREVRKIDKSKGRVKVYKLMPDQVKGIEIDRVEFEPGAIMGGHPHLAGTKEYMTVIKGEVLVYIDGEDYSVKKGDVLAFPGNQAHSYRNPKTSESIAISIVIPVPSFT